MPEQASLLAAEQPDEVIARALAEHSPIATYCLFSGGGDSAVLAHRCREDYAGLIFLDTGTALPGVVEHVEAFAAWLDKPLRVYRSERDEFRAMVLGLDEDRSRAQNWRPLGFPGPAQHGRAYNRLKERLLETAKRDAKAGHPRSARVAFLTGLRRAESSRRRGRRPINRKRAAVFINPLIDWPDSAMRAYREQHALPESDVAALLHRSGECNCGSFATAGERDMLRSLWPDWFEGRIASLEREAAEAGIVNCRWGNRPSDAPPASSDDDVLCSSCIFRQERLEGI